MQYATTVYAHATVAGVGLGGVRNLTVPYRRTTVAVWRSTAHAHAPPHGPPPTAHPHVAAEIPLSGMPRKHPERICSHWDP